MFTREVRNKGKYDQQVVSTMTELCFAVPTAPDVSTRQESKPRNFCTAIHAFVIGTLLSLAAWISNQGWAVCSILLFGDFSVGNMWKHILFSVSGSLIIALAWCLSFKSCFPGDDDVAEHLQDLGELGFIFGYILAEYLGIGIFGSNDFDKFLPLVIVLWALLTLLKNYRKEVKRVAATDFLIGSVEIV